VANEPRRAHDSDVRIYLCDAAVNNVWTEISIGERCLHAARRCAYVQELRRQTAWNVDSHRALGLRDLLRSVRGGIRQGYPRTCRNR